MRLQKRFTNGLTLINNFIWNRLIDKRPALIARCADVADVMVGVSFAREKKLLLAVRGGAHNGPGLGSVDDQCQLTSL